MKPAATRRATSTPASTNQVDPLAYRVTAEGEPSDDETALRLAQLPKEAGWMLIAAGVIGVAVPGVLGAPFLLAGAMVVTPGAAKLLSRWGDRKPPKLVRSAVRQIARFADDLERRYPHNKAAIDGARNREER
jgi:hypothetical protein